MVHTFCVLLATRCTGAGRLPVRLAIAVAVPHRGDRSSRRSGGRFPRDYTAVPAVGGAVPNLDEAG